MEHRGTISTHLFRVSMAISRSWNSLWTIRAYSIFGSSGDRNAFQDESCLLSSAVSGQAHRPLELSSFRERARLTADKWG
ncbi:MAG: hypothetical protein FIB07_09105 [Candidatus Methanoperedens sp.]|nr:hypothetical protein [Candidatus Methanoperedens sp.]